MIREIHGWHSPSLNKHMDLVMYGHYGFALLLLPTAAADYLEYERFEMIHALHGLIEAGKIKVFSINSINAESWLNDHMHPRDKSIRHQHFNNYVYQEVIPFIKTHTSENTSIIVSGASLGALHSANLFFKRPDMITGLIAMSGNYRLTTYTRGYWDEDVYFNSPMDYLEKLDDSYYLPMLQAGRPIHILTGSGDYETPDHTRNFSTLLHHKAIPHHLDVWGHDMPHDWPTWRTMLPYILDKHF